jgi:hypothetical protein
VNLVVLVNPVVLVTLSALAAHEDRSLVTGQSNDSVDFPAHRHHQSQVQLALMKARIRLLQTVL